MTIPYVSYTEEIEEHGYCQQRPDLRTGDKYLYEVEGKKRLHIVWDVHLDRYVWENVAQWSTVIEEYFEEEYSLCLLHSDIPVFVANGLIGVLSRDKDLVKGELIIPAKIGNLVVRGVAPFGFFSCPHLTKIVFSPMVLNAHEYAFAHSGLREMVFNDEVPVFLHPSAIDGRDSLPAFNIFFDRPFPGKYLFRYE